MKYLLLLFLILTLHFSKAQNTAAGNIQPKPVYMNNPVEINVDDNGPVENLLIVISDSTGQTVFLDNRFHFVGPYIRNVDLSRSGKGPFSLCIAKDADRSYTRFYLK